MFNPTTALKAAAIFAATMASAQAATFQLGNLVGNTVTIGQSFAPGATISDSYIFDIMPASSYASIVTSINLAPYFSIDGLIVSLSGNGMTPIIQSLGNGQTALSLGPVALSAGTGYDFHVSGTATGVLGGAYAGALAAATTPVPLPAAAWLLGSGLAGLAGIARRRRARA